MNFYRINEKHKALIHKAELEAEQNEGEISDLVYNELVNTESDLLECGETLLLMAKEKMILSAAIKDEIKQLQERSKKLDAQAESYKGIAVNGCGVQAGERAGLVLKSTTSKAVNVINEEEVPEEYKKTKIVTTVDKTKAMKDLKAGKSIKGCELEERVSWKIK